MCLVQEACFSPKNVYNWAKHDIVSISLCQNESPSSGNSFSAKE